MDKVTIPTLDEFEGAIDILQRAASAYYLYKGFTAGPATLALGAMEELGEIAQALLLTTQSDYKLNQNSHKLDALDEMTDTPMEIGDCLTYLLHLANALGSTVRCKRIALFLAEEK